MSRPVIVIKVGGNELASPGFISGLVESVTALQKDRACVLVHGGGRTIDRMMEQLDVRPQYHDGQRITDEAVLEIAEMVLSGQVNKTLVLALLDAGLDALGMSGVDRRLIEAEPWSPQMDRVGRITSVRADVLHSLCSQDVIPVISPISSGPGGKYNVNADYAAGAIGGALGAEQVAFISNVPGVLLEGSAVQELSPEAVQAHIRSGAIHGGMVPKVNAALQALAFGAKAAVITDLAGFKSSRGTTIHNMQGEAV